MAKIQEEIYMIKLSKLVKDTVEAPEDIIEDRIILNVESLIQQMVNDTAILVEVEKV